MARDPGGPDATVSGEASAMMRSRRPPQWLKVRWPRFQRWSRKPEAKVLPRDTNRRRGCRKATPRAVRPLEPGDRLPRRPLAVSWSAAMRSAVADKAPASPVAPPAPTPGTDGACAK